MKYLYETHFHTAEVSPCGNVPVLEGLKMYREAGYSGVMITDHFSTGYMKNSYPGDTWKEKMDHYLSGYRLGRKAADDDFAVILGMELRFPDAANDYLLFGINEDWLYENEWFCETDLKSFKRIAERIGISIVQAHPFRKDMKIVEARYIDGMEVFNGNRRHQSNDVVAARWAETYKLFPTSGSDFHEYEDFARGGIYLDSFVKDSRELRGALLSGKYELKTLD